ncbi:MAG: hypothetical protein PHY93_16675 [Bacteriovorax sp.]|nr:hypothetical protein [Bacteriovorax sp.]
MNFKKLSSILFLLVFFVSCNEYEKLMGPILKIKLADSNPNPIFDGEAEPPIPNRFENDRTILGIDSNNNGIRDDVDIWINRTALDYNERMAMRQYARAEQDELRVCSLELKDETSKVVTESMNSSYCLNSLSDHKRKVRDRTEFEVDKLTFSSKDRIDCRGFYDRNSFVAGGGDISKPYLNCKFKIQNLESEIKAYKNFGSHSR